MDTGIPTGIPTKILAFLDNGPVHLLVGCDHTDCAGLPAAFAGKVLGLRLTLAEDGEAVKAAAAEPRFCRRYRGEDGLAEAMLPWAGVLAIAGWVGPGQHQYLLRPGELPAHLGDGADASRGLHRMLARMGAAPSLAYTGLLAWQPAPSSGTLPSAPTRPEALRQLVAERVGQTTLLVQSDALPPKWSKPGGIAQVPLTAAEPTITPIFMEAILAHPAEPPEQVQLAWLSVVAMQDEATGRGWIWPESLPPEVRAQMALELQVHTDDLIGVGLPLRPTTGADNLVRLPAPPEVDKRRALLASLQQGGALLLIATDAAGLQMPGDFGELPLLVVPVGAHGDTPTAQAQINGLFVRATIPDFDGRPSRLTIPWNAVFAVASNEGIARIHCWPRDYPAAVRCLLEAAAQLEADGATPEGVHLRAPAVGLRREGDHVQAVVLQPIGPPDGAGVRPMLQIDFALPAEGEGG